MDKELVVILTGAAPIAELRGAIPLALSFGIPPLKAFLLSVLGNLIPIIPILCLLNPVSEKLRHFKFWSNFFDWVFEKTKKKSDLIQKYEALGLCLFVAIPLPMTGAWSGCIAASLFKIRFRYAFLAISTGVILAGIIVLAVCLTGINTFKIFVK